MQNSATAKSGQILILSLVLTAILLILAGALLSVSSGGYSFTNKLVKSNQAVYVAEAGIEKAIGALNQTGSVDESEISFGNGTYIVRDLTQTGEERVLESTGYIPNATNPRSSKKVRVKAKVSGDSIQFFYGIQVDEGGVEMTNNSRVIGNIYSNGSISGGNGATVTGDAIVAGGAAPALDQAQETTTSTQTVGQTSAAADIAQAFIPSQTSSLTKITLYLAKTGSPSSLPVKIVTDNNNKPSKTQRANATLSGASVGLSPSWIDLSFGSPPTLTAGTRYWIILDGSTNSTNYFIWGKDTADSYPNGKPMKSANWNAGSPNWSDLTGDQAFRVYVGGTPTSIDNVDVNGSVRANTIKDLSVGGDAYFQSLINSNVAGTQYPNSPDSPHEDLPISDGVVQDWKNNAQVGGTLTGNYVLTNGAQDTLGPKIIAGDLNLSNNATLTITGTLWVQGNVNLSNNCIVKLDPGYGTSSGIIITDNLVNISNNCSFQGSGTAGSYVLLLSTKNMPTQTVMNIANNSLGVIYYAAKGKIEFSNNAQAKEATAWGMELSNGVTITYESGLADIFFTNGPGGGWTVIKGTYQEL